MAEYITCRNCSSPDCRGCNVYTLAMMLSTGKFDCLMNGNRCVDRFADVAPVVWMPVLGFEGLYEVSGLGQVRNQKGEILKQGIKRTPCTCYKIVHLWKDGVYYTKYVHRLIAEAFIPNPDNLPMVNHKDEDKTNNFLENLEWCTAAYNRTYGKAVERQAKKLRGRESEKRVAVVGYTPDGIYEEWFPSIAEAAKIVNGSTSAISKVCKGERKIAYGYRWAYADDFCSYGERKDGEGNG